MDFPPTSLDFAPLHPGYSLPNSGGDDDDSSSVVALAADPVDHTAWVARDATLRHYRLTGQVVHTRTFGTTRLRALVLYTDLLPPTLSFLTPAAGAVLNTNRPPLTLSASDRGQGVDPSTLQLRANTVVFPSPCTITPPELACRPGSALPEGAVALSATVADFAGNVSLPATRQVTIDTTPPAAPQSGRITVGTVSNGQVTVSGTAGSVEGGSQVRITNARTGQVSTVTAAGDGSFTATVAAQAGDSFSVIVQDAAGNAGPGITLQVARALNVQITAPTNGSSVPTGMVMVRGIVTGGGPDMGVTVNGVVAAVQGENFALLVPVTTVTTTLTAQATRAGVSAVNDEITITPTLPADNVALFLSASAESGQAPLRTTFTLIALGSVSALPTHVALDADGDGHTDFEGATLEEQSFTYSQPGLYFPTASVTTTQGKRTVRTIVQVFDANALDALLQAKWHALKDALQREDIAQALTHIGSRSRARYQEVFQTLTPPFPDIDTILTTIRLQEIRDGEARYEMLRPAGAMTKSFEVRFHIDDDGIWRLTSF